MFAVGVRKVLIGLCICGAPSPHVKIPLSHWCVNLSMKKKGLVLCECVRVCASAVYEEEERDRESR